MKLLDKHRFVAAAMVIAAGCGTASVLPAQGPAYRDCPAEAVSTSEAAALRSAIVDAATFRSARGKSTTAFFSRNEVLIGRAELRPRSRDLIAYIQGQDYCGSGGCLAVVLRREESSGNRRVNFTSLGRISSIRPPIAVLRSSHQGWRDIAFLSEGGGVRTPSSTLLRYNQGRYQKAATPATARAVDAGQRIIGEQSRQTCRLR